MTYKLDDVKGLGTVSVQKLNENGISTIDELLTVNPQDLASMLSITKYKAKAVIMDAKTKILETAPEFWTANELESYRKLHQKKISTGSPQIDTILEGGVWTDAINTFTGELGTGKSQICHQLAVNCVIDHNRDAVYLETEPSTLSPARLRAMAEARGAKAEDVLDRIHVLPAGTVGDPFMQMISYQLVNKKVQEGKDIGVLIVDSFTARFRQTYLGREMLSDRSQEIASHIGYLEMLASKHNLAVVLTTQVMGIPDVGEQIASRMRYGGAKKPYGGELFLHASTIWMYLQKKATDEWQLTVFDAPLPRVTALFKITEEGIR